MKMPADIIARIRHIEVYTKRLLGSLLLGKNRSRLKGMGFEFDQLREYQIGDDIRSIDWSSSARTQSIRVKQYLEERVRTVCIMVDVSSSMAYGIEEKYATSVWLASVMILVAAYGGDKVGLMLYSDVVELYIPPSSGLMHARTLMHCLFSYKPHRSTTNILAAYTKLHLLKERSLIYVVSDFIDTHLEKAVARITRRHQLCAVRYLDARERALPDKGIICMRDQESGAIHMIDMAQAGQIPLQMRIQNQDYLFKKYGIRVFDIFDQQQPMWELVKLLSSGIS